MGLQFPGAVVVSGEEDGIHQQGEHEDEVLPVRHQVGAGMVNVSYSDFG